MNIPDLSWEEIETNIKQFKKHEARAVKQSYLDEIIEVNAALEQGATLSIRTAGHGFTCPPGALLGCPGCPPPEECQLILKKVIVTFRCEDHMLIYNVALWFWDTTHEEDDIWGAITAQPQWDTLLSQARTYLTDEHEADAS